MRIPSTHFRPGRPHGFGARPAALGPITAAIRYLKHKFLQATDRAIGAQLCDLRLNPFLFLVESGC
ncbi:MAG TPA: hypothetical protein VMU87_20800 [Stellaceae bacterium]|nr:hypothetical protein [Stellaceae bacterium]